MRSPILQGGAHRRRRPRLLPIVLAVFLAAAGASLALRTWPAKGGSEPSGRAASAPAVARWTAAKLLPPAIPRDLVVARGPMVRTGLGEPLTADAAILVEGTNGTVLFAKREHLRLPVASTTKIMTALIALERLAPRDVVTIDPAAARAAPFREGLRPGERVAAWKLFHGLMLYSGNDDALALAIASAGSRTAFLRLMNERARDLGLRDTKFVSPSGLVDRGNYSTAWDLAAITRHALQNARFRTIVRTRVKRVAWAAPTYAKVYVNKNHLLGAYPGADGVKTGWTTLAGHCLVASATRHGIRLIAVVLGADDAYADVRRLLDYGFSRR
ncbi:MAG: D-alanyl-D-alanine carboxypeptidase [Actinobacteria bacterium]|nr:D-alanyl-D-alanine carboxypeptidase [Actinomycetota bacterium]